MPTDLPATSVPWTLDPGRAVLLIHDLQRHFLAPFAQQANPFRSLLANTVALRAAADAAGVPVVYTAQPGDQDPAQRALLIDFWGRGPAAGAPVEIIDELAPREHDIVLTKWRYSAFQRTPLLDLLRKRGRDQLIVTGVYAHIGCQATAVEAFMQDISPFLVADALADFSAADHDDALRYVARRCGRVLTSADVLAGLAAGTGARVDLDVLLGWVSELLGEAVEPDEDLLNAGLDSIRVLSVQQRLRDAGHDVSFADLAEAPTVRAWQARLRA